MVAKSHPVGFLYQLSWLSPYTDPPDGGPRVLAERYVPVDHPGAGAPGCPADLMAMHVLGSGYVISCQAIMEPQKTLSKETRVSIRRKRLESRMRKKYPLLADQFIQEAIEARPAYYIDGVGDFDAEREAILEAERERFERLTGATDRK